MLTASLAALAVIAAPGRPLDFTGVNLAGAEFGFRANQPRVFGTDYDYPHANEVDYFAAKGMNVFRIPFLWESMQPTLGGPLDPTELARLTGIVGEITRRGLVAVVDPHNYARYHGRPIGAEVPIEAFADFWGRLAQAFKGDDRVWLGLVNEPHDMPTADWLAAANAAIAAIRKNGAKNLILVPGNHWSGAHSWVGSDNGTAMLGVKDPANRYAFEVHQYLDEDSSGTHRTVVGPQIGAERLKTFTEWCRKHRKRAFLGEFGVASGEEGRVAIGNMLGYMEANREVWLGFAWWAAGPRWGEYMFTLEPKDLRDRPQLATLRPHLQPLSMAPRPAKRP